jgi:hypothetical protein
MTVTGRGEGGLVYPGRHLNFTYYTVQDAIDWYLSGNDRSGWVEFRWPQERGHYSRGPWQGAVVWSDGRSRPTDGLLGSFDQREYAETAARDVGVVARRLLRAWRAKHGDAPTTAIRGGTEFWPPPYADRPCTRCERYKGTAWRSLYLHSDGTWAAEEWVCGECAEQRS